MMILIAILLPALLGFLVLTLLLQTEGDAPTGLLERLALSFPLGSGILTMQMFFMGIARVPITLQTTTGLILCEIILLSFWIWKNKIELFSKPVFGLYEEMTSPETSRIKKLALIALTAWVGVKLGSIFLETYLRPIYAWDSWANWSAGAKAFYYSHGLLLDDPGELYGRNAVSRAGVLSSPPLNPLMQVWLALWIGTFDEVLVKFWTPVYLLSMTVYLYIAGSRELNRLVALGLLAIFMSSPLMSYHSTEVYSDLPLGSYILFALASFLNAMRSKPYWVLAGLFSAEAIFTKNEASGFVIPLLLSAFLYLWLHKREQPLYGNSLKLIVPLLSVIPWFIFKSHYSLSLIHEHVKFEIVFQPDVMAQTVKNFLSLENFNILLIALPFLIMISKPTKEFLHVFSPVGLYAVSFIVLYAVIPGYYEVFVKGTVFYRNVLTYYPSVCLLTILILKELKQKPSAINLQKRAAKQPKPR